MRILVIADCLPFPPIGGGRLGIYNRVQAIAVEHDITMIGFTYDIEPVSPPVNVVAVPWEAPLSPSNEPLFASWTASERLILEVIEQVSKNSFDLVIIENSYMARVLAVLPEKLPKVLDMHDVHSLMAQRAIERTTGESRTAAILEAERTIHYESSVAKQCVLCLVLSESEAKAARSLLKVAHIEIVASGIDTKTLIPSEVTPIKGYVLFTGSMDYAPNIEAVTYFSERVLPLICERVPGMQFHIVGARPTDSVLALAAENVVIHGQVPDIRPYFQRAEVVVVPLLHGGGIRLKILEAAACGKPIVSTSLGAEGLDFTNGLNIIIADTAPTFADNVVLLLEDETKRKQLGQNARKASLAYDCEEIGDRLRSILRSLAEELGL